MQSEVRVDVNGGFIGALNWLTLEPDLIVLVWVRAIIQWLENELSDASDRSSIKQITGKLRFGTIDVGLDSIPFGFGKALGETGLPILIATSNSTDSYTIIVFGESCDSVPVALLGCFRKAETTKESVLNCSNCDWI